MLPPLYEIQRSMENMSRRYGNKVYLNALLPGEERDLKYEGAAPRSAVNGFMSNLADQIYRLNIIRGTIESEKRQRVTLANMYFAVSIILAILIGGTIAYTVTTPRFICSSFTSLERIEGAYFLALIMLIIIYVIIVSVRLLQKNKSIYDMVYRTDVFYSEPQTRHIFEMVQFKNGFRFKNGDTVKADGTNPLAAYFIHRNKGFNVNFTFVETRATCNNGRPEAPTTSCAGSRKTYAFTNPSSKKKKATAYTLDCSGDTGLLNKSNLPCSVLDNKGRMVVDPFIDGFNNPVLLKKKLERYDFYGQMNRLREAITYFKTFLDKQYDEKGNTLMEEKKKDIERMISEALKLDFLVIRGITPYENSLRLLGKQPFTSSPEATVLSCGMLNVCRLSCFISDGMGGGFGYGLTVDDLSKLVFRFENNPKSDNFIVIKATDVQLKLITETPPSPSVLNSLYNIGSIMNNASKIPVYGACTAIVDEQKGLVECKDSVVHTPLRKTPFGPSISALFAETPAPEVGERNTNVPQDVFLINIDASSLFRQSMNTFMDSSLTQAKPLIIKRILDILESEDPARSFNFDTATTNRIRNAIKDYYGTSFSKVTSIINDILIDVPIEINKRENAEMMSNTNDPRKKFITYDRFMAKLSGLTQSDFVNTFYQHIETIRATSAGLKSLYDTYNFKDDAHQKNMEVLDITWVILVVVGLCELLRFAFRNFIIAGNEATCNDLKFNLNKDAKNNEDSVKWHLIKRKKLWTQAGLQTSMFIMVYVLIVALIYSWKEKSRGIYNFNNIVLNKNGDSIAGSAHRIMDAFTEAIVKDGQLIRISTSYTDTGDNDETFLNVVKAALIEGGEAKVKLDASYDLVDSHESLISIIEAYEKCNTLLSTEKLLPFPLTEIVLYLMMIVVIVILALLVIFKLHPFEKMAKLRKWTKLRRMMDMNIEIAEGSYGFDCKDDGIAKAEIENTITIIVSILIAVISIMFALMIIGNTNIFTDALYASDLFKNSECYNL